MARHHRHFDQVSGILRNRRDIEDLVEALQKHQIRDEDISMLMSDQTRGQLFSASSSSKAPEGATIGAVSGGVLGMIIGGLTLAGTVLAPGIGLLVSGPLIGALSAGAVGGVAGGIIGALVGAGIPEHEAKFYEDALKKEGNVLVVAHVLDEQTDEVKAVFKRFGAQQVKVHG